MVWFFRRIYLCPKYYRYCNIITRNFSYKLLVTGVYVCKPSAEKFACVENRSSEMVWARQLEISMRYWLYYCALLQRNDKRRSMLQLHSSQTQCRIKQKDGDCRRIVYRVLRRVIFYPMISSVHNVRKGTHACSPNISGKSKKYSWCIPVQMKIKLIIWGVAITPEPWNRQQC